MIDSQLTYRASLAEQYHPTVLVLFMAAPFLLMVPWWATAATLLFCWLYFCRR